MELIFLLRHYNPARNDRLLCSVKRPGSSRSCFSILRDSLSQIDRGRGTTKPGRIEIDLVEADFHWNTVIQCPVIVTSPKWGGRQSGADSFQYIGGIVLQTGGGKRKNKRPADGEVTHRV